MGRVRSLAIALLEKHRETFTNRFEDNKAILGQLAVIRSKQLRNELAGYITRVIKEEQGTVKEEETVTEVLEQSTKAF